MIGMKNKMTKKIVSAALALMLTISLFAALPLELSAAAAHEHIVQTSQIQNDYLSVRSDGDRHVLYTTGGDPDNSNDDYARLLYDCSSKTVINVDGVTYTFAPQDIEMATPDGDSLYSYFYINGQIKIERFISFSYNTYTARYDTVEYKYVMTNLSNEYPSVGARLFFDTMLGSNDGAPFRIAGRNVTEACTYVGDAIPQVWQVFDDLNYPSVVASGTFYSSDADKPDKVQFLSYGRGSGDQWDCDADGYNIGDSAVNVYFDPETLAPGESKTVKTYYGISAFTPSNEDTEDGLGFAAIAPREMMLSEDGAEYLGNPFTFNGWISNNGGETLTNVKAVLSLPAELSAEETTIYFGDVYPGEEKNVSFIINAQEMSYSHTAYYTVSIYSDSATIDNEYSIFLPETTERSAEISIDKTDTVAIGDTFLMTVSVADIGYADAVAITPIYNDYALELVGIEWLVSADLQDADIDRNRTLSAWADPTALDGDLISFKFLAKEEASYAYVSAEILVQNDGYVDSYHTPEHVFSVDYCAHRHTRAEQIDEYRHAIICEDCGDYREEYHHFNDEHDIYCEICDYTDIRLGDMNGDRWVDDNDAVKLLMHVFFPAQNPIYQDGDLDRNGVVDADDAVYLQMHIYFPTEYPLS